MIKFVRGGEKPPTIAKTNNVLQKAQAWEMRVDLEGILQFPWVVQADLRPDVLLWSDKAKKIVFIEPVPWK